MTRARFVLGTSALIVVLVVLGLCIGSDGLSFDVLSKNEQASVIVGQIRLPRTIGAALVGALLALSGALAQGLFRNPLADPFLLGSSAGASLAVVLVLASSALVGSTTALWLAHVGLALAAFVGAIAGVAITLVLARGAQQTVRLLLAGVVVGMVLGAASDLITLVSPEALRGRQVFLLGTTGFLSWSSVVVLGVGLVVALPLAMRFARVLDALTLGEETAASLGLPIARLRLVLVLVFAWSAGLAVSQAGLVAFVGLVAPHIVRRVAPGPHGYLLAASALTGAVLLLVADLVARVAIAPQELPVGVITALFGGGYLLWLLHRRGAT